MIISQEKCGNEEIAVDKNGYQIKRKRNRAINVSINTWSCTEGGKNG
jgi:hypothetical protein